MDGGSLSSSTYQNQLQDYKASNMFPMISIIATLLVIFHQHQCQRLGKTEPTLDYAHRHPPAPVHYVNINADLAGAYKFGYDTGKGPSGQSFREETRLEDGTVKGAYGILDSQGHQRIIRYTAGKDGFVAVGDVGHDGVSIAPGPAPLPAHQVVPILPPRTFYKTVQPTSQPDAQDREDGQYDPKWDRDYYDHVPAFVDVERLSYDIGAAGGKSRGVRRERRM